MKIKVNLESDTCSLEGALRGITFGHNNTKVIKGWIKKIYGLNVDNEIIINEAEFIPENTIVNLDFDKMYGEYNPYEIQITTVTTKGSYAEVKDGKLERVILGKLHSFVYMGCVFTLSEEGEWLVIDEDVELIATYSDMFDVLDFMYNEYTSWLKSEQVNTVTP